MNNVEPYLFFNGNCREAMTFYKECLGGELTIMNFADMPGEVEEEDKNRVMHSILKGGGISFMASDSDSNHGKLNFGDNFCININVENIETADNFYNKLSAGGNATMPMEKTFWGAYFGMLKDKFGVNWMINCELK